SSVEEYLKLPKIVQNELRIVRGSFCDFSSDSKDLKIHPSILGYWFAPNREDFTVTDYSLAHIFEKHKDVYLTSKIKDGILSYVPTLQFGYELSNFGRLKIPNLYMKANYDNLSMFLSGFLMGCKHSYCSEISFTSKILL